MITRKAEAELRHFFRHDHRTLLLTGARQTGKTFTIRKTGRECFAHFVEINFIEQPEAKQLFQQPANAKEILLRLSAAAKQKLVPGKTLIFFDEVQECKEIVTAIKFLVDDGSFRYVLSGSLLGVELQDIRSVPVGYLAVKEMFPVNLEEFAIALGIGMEVMEHLHNCFMEKTPVDPFIHERMMQLVRLYLLVGGMPAAVQRYMDTNDLQQVVSIQRDIIRLYRQDISRYVTHEKLLIREIFDLIPSELNAKNKRFILKNLNEKKRFERVEAEFVWLKEAGVAIPVYNVTEPRPPLLLNKQRNLFKLFLNDVGLLSSQFYNNLHICMFSGKENVNYGAIFENFAAQELTAHGFLNPGRGLFYFNSKKQGELDFVLEINGKILPVEIKSGKDYHRHNALDQVMNNREYGIPEAFVFCPDNIRVVNRTVHFPIYMLMCCHNRENAPLLHRIDLSGMR